MSAARGSRDEGRARKAKESARCAGATLGESSAAGRAAYQVKRLRDAEPHDCDAGGTDQELCSPPQYHNQPGDEGKGGENRPSIEFIPEL